MSDLIKENRIASVITMTRPQAMAISVVAITAVFLLSIAQPVVAADTRPPNIYEWGIEGQPELGQGFDVWANVSDDETGLRNVTVQVFGPNMTVNNLMSYNGTYFTGSVPAFPNDGTFNVRIQAFDLANNTRTSAFHIIEFEANPPPTIPENITLPFVVGSSIALMAVVIVLALVYDRRKNT